MTITYTEQEKKQIELIKLIMKPSPTDEYLENFASEWIKLIIGFKIRLGEKDAQVYIDKTCEMLKEYVINKL